MSTRTALLCLAIAFVPLAQSKPDFSGKWKLNVEESEFPGAKPSPDRFTALRTVVQKQNELRLKVERISNGQKSGFDFITIRIGSGEPHVSDEAGIVTAQWKDDTLHFNYLYNPGTEREAERTEDWTLSPDGKKLIDQEWGRRADGQEGRSKIVFDKQP